MVYIEDILAEQTNKVYGELNGGIKYGRDCNRLKAILHHHRDKNLVNAVAETLEDEVLKAKVEVWIGA